MAVLRLFVSVAILFALVNCDELPSYFLRCRKSDPFLGQCVAASTNKAMHYFAPGDPRYGIPSIKPLVIPRIAISARGMRANLTNATINGISNSKIMDARLNFNAKHFSFIIKTPQIHITSNYSVSGRFLMIPFSSNGSASITFNKLNMKFSFMYRLTKFAGEEYIQLTNATLIYAFDNISLDLENLSHIHNATKSDLDNLFAKHSFGNVNDIGMKIGEAVGEAIANILSNLFEKVPYSKLFDP